MRLQPAPMPITALVFSPDGSMLAGAGDNPTELIRTAFSKDGRYFGIYGNGTMVSSHQQGSVFSVWDLKTCKIARAVALSADGKPSQDWIEWAPDGIYDWSPGASALIRWRMGDKLYPASAYGKEIPADYH